MAVRRVIKKDDPKTRRRPGTTLESRENQVIAAAVDLAEKQILEGTASAQVLTHYLKLGSSREKLEQERLANENSLTMAKIEAMASAARVEELYSGAINAMRAYAGHDPLQIDAGESDEDYL